MQIITTAILVLLVASASAQNLVDTLSANGFTSLVSAASGFPDLVALLQSTTVNTTVFAPTNDAFAAAGTLPEGDELKSLLLYHLTGGSVYSTALAAGLLIPTLNTLQSLNNASQVLSVTLTDSVFYLNNAGIVAVDLQASNGVIHTLNAVITEPLDIVTIASNTPNLSTLVTAVVAAGLVTALQGPALTVFAPVNAAFNALPTNVLPYLLTTQGKSDLTSILTYHVLGSVAYASNVPTSPTSLVTLNGESIEIVRNGATNAVTITDGQSNTASVTSANVIASNGVVHVINSVLIPASFVFTLDKLLYGLNNTILVEAIVAAGLGDILTGSAPYTILAPTNAAFEAVQLPTNITQLAEILKLHVIAGSVLSSSLVNLQTPPTLLTLSSLNGQSQVVDVTITGGNVFFQTNSQVITADQTASNGVVHVINKVLLPPSDIVTIAASTPDLSTLVTAVTAAGLGEALTGPALTVFAPLNTAFNALPTNVLPYLLTAQGKGDLTSILTYHVLGSVAYALNVPTTLTSLPTLNGASIDIIRDATTNAISITDGQSNTASVALPNVIASNGAVHVIDSVLIPASFVFTLDKLLYGLGNTVLVEAIVAAGLAGVLNGTTPYTILAPTNAAFEGVQLPTNITQLAEILKLHVIAGSVLSSDLVNLQTPPTLLTLSSLNGQSQVVDVTITNGNVFFQTNSQVITADQTASNGVVHVINKVLLPPSDIVTIAASTPDLSTLVAAVTAAGLGEALTGPALTVFAPLNTAFNALPTNVLPYLLTAQGKGDLTSILTYHVLGSVAYALNVPTTLTSLPTLNGASIDIIRDATTNAISITDGQSNTASVALPNVIASNGAVHVINSVLIPASFVFTLDKLLYGLGNTVLVEAIVAAGLAGVLNGTTPYTILAPTNAAFEGVQLPTNITQLAEILKLHVIAGSVLSSDLVNLQTPPTLLTLSSLNGQSQVVDVTIVGGNVFFQNNSQVTTADQAASNGVVHVINKVLLPPSDIVTIAITTPELSTLVQAVTAAGLVQALQGPALTVFAPLNTAFNALPTNVLPYLLTAQGKGDLTSILTYHVLGSVAYALDVPTTLTPLPTLNGASIDIIRNAATNAISITDGQSNTASVALPNVIASNGAVHVINSVLIPASFVFTLDKLLYGLGNTVLVEAIVAAGLAGVLNGTTPYTILAPTNAAFEGLPPVDGVALANLLKYHVIAGRVESSQLQNLQIVNTVNGQNLDVTVNANGVSFQSASAQVTIANQLASNGVVHVINKVLSVPVDIPTTVINSPQYSTLLAAVVAAGLVDTLKTPNLTVFGPDNAAFNALPPAQLQYLLLPEQESKADLISILAYHVLTSVVYALNVPVTPTSVPTFGGLDVVVSRNNATNAVSVGAAQVNLPNIIASNGVIHGINSVLLPPSGVTFTNQKVLKGLNASLFLTALTAAGLTQYFNSTSTLFAPTDAAFLSVPGINDILANTAELTTILNSHISLVVISAPGEYATLNSDISLSVTGTTVSIVGQSVSANIISVTTTSTGVVYSIDAVLANPSSPSSGLSGGAIAGIVIGVIVGVLLIVGLIVYVRGRRAGYDNIDNREPLVSKA